MISAADSRPASGAHPRQRVPLDACSGWRRLAACRLIASGVLVVPVLLCIAGLSTAIAQDTGSGSNLEWAGRRVSGHPFKVAPAVSHTLDADFRNRALGSVSVTRFDTRLDYTTKIGPGELGTGGSYELSHYDASRLGVLDDHFNRLTFDAQYIGAINRTWGYLGYGGLTLAARSDASLADGLLGRGGAGLSYAISTRSTVGAGAGFATRLEDDPVFFPVLFFQWRISERLRLRALNGLMLTYDLFGDRKVFLDGGVRYQRREYRLPDDPLGRGAPGRDHALIDRALLGEAGATWQFKPNAAIRGSVSAVSRREFQVRSQGRRLLHEKTDLAVMLGLRGILSF
jgi:hypothetical protein